MEISVLFPEINSWSLCSSVVISKPPKISKSKRRRLMKKARSRSRQVLEDNEEAVLMKGAPPLSVRPSIALPTQAVDHQAVIEGVNFLHKENTLPAANVVMDKRVPEVKALILACPYDLRPRSR